MYTFGEGRAAFHDHGVTRWLAHVSSLQRKPSRGFPVTLAFPFSIRAFVFGEEVAPQMIGVGNSTLIRAQEFRCRALSEKTACCNDTESSREIDHLRGGGRAFVWDIEQQGKRKWHREAGRIVARRRRSQEAEETRRSSTPLPFRSRGSFDRSARIGGCCERNYRKVGDDS